MRIFWWACMFLGVLICSTAYLHFNQPSLPTASPGAPEQSERPPLDQKPEQALASKDERRLQEVDPAPARLEPDQLSNGQEEARLEDIRDSAAIERSEPNEPKQSLSWLAYYAYSELPPETKPADTVLDALKDIPPGTPVEEIRRVADILGLDFTFMKAIAKIESNFNPKARTGSYIGLFQLSKYEFAKHGSGDILVSRDNTVAAALKMSTEAVLFEMFNRRKPTLNDLYLIHQQGIDACPSFTRDIPKPLPIDRRKSVWWVAGQSTRTVRNHQINRFVPEPQAPSAALTGIPPNGSGLARYPSGVSRARHAAHTASRDGSWKDWPCWNNDARP